MLPETNPNRVTSPTPVKCDNCEQIIPPAINFYALGLLSICDECYIAAKDHLMSSPIEAEWPEEIDVLP